LLAATGTADPGIRATIAAEQDELNDTESQYLLDDVFPSLRTYRGADVKDAIKPAEERARLSELSGGSRTFDPTPTIGTIPSTPGTAPTPAVPVPAQPLIEPVAPAARAPIDASLGEELIFIPE